MFSNSCFQEMMISVNCKVSELRTQVNHNIWRTICGVNAYFYLQNRNIIRGQKDEH